MAARFLEVSGPSASIFQWQEENTIKKNKDHHARFYLRRDHVLGAPVFNTYGKLVGFVQLCGTSFDFKFGVRSEYLHDAMYKWLSGNNGRYDSDSLYPVLPKIALSFLLQEKNICS
jgi:hypothetical protein